MTQSLNMMRIQTISFRMFRSPSTHLQAPNTFRLFCGLFLLCSGTQPNTCVSFQAFLRFPEAAYVSVVWIRQILVGRCGFKSWSPCAQQERLSSCWAAVMKDMHCYTMQFQNLENLIACPRQFRHRKQQAAVEGELLSSFLKDWAVVLL